MSRRLALTVVTLSLIPVVTLAAQDATSGRNSVSLSAGAMQFDLSGTGTAPMYALRVDRALTRIVVGEAGIGFARPEQQFGTRTSLVVPELALQFQVPIQRVRPYLGLGTGFAMDLRDDTYGGMTTRVTVSGALGSRFVVTDRIGARAELRVRGIGTGFGGSTAEWTGGLAWRF